MLAYFVDKGEKTLNLLKICSQKLYGYFAPFFLTDDKRYKGYQIGEGTYGKPAVISWGGQGSYLKIGKYCSIAPDVVIMLGGEHRWNWISTYPFNKVFKEAAHLKGHPHTKGDVVIGHDVWIGMGAIIFSGVKIGNGAIIGARSVVRKNVPAYGVVAGNPAEFLFSRFPRETIDTIEKIAWWDWPEEKVKATAAMLMSDKVSEFIEMYFPKST